MRIVKENLEKNTESLAYKIVDYDLMLRVKEKVETVLADFNVSVFEVFYSDYRGLYEVIVEESDGSKYVVYVDSGLEKVYLGHIIDSETGRDLTKERIDYLNGLKSF